MARPTGPQVKRARRLGIALTDKQLRHLSKRSAPPGQHGPKGQKRLSEYGKQLQEKQKAKFVYGMLERQFRGYFEKAHNKSGDTGLNLYRMLEMRLDNAVYRAGLTKTRPQARQLVSHAHLTVNGKKVDVPSYGLSVGDVVTVREKSKDAKIFADAKDNFQNIEQPSWIVTDIDKLEFKVTDQPSAENAVKEFDPKAVIEFYSR